MILDNLFFSFRTARPAFLQTHQIRQRRLMKENKKTRIPAPSTLTPQMWRPIRTPAPRIAKQQARKAQRQRQAPWRTKQKAHQAQRRWRQAPLITRQKIQRRQARRTRQKSQGQSHEISASIWSCNRSQWPPAYSWRWLWSTDHRMRPFILVLFTTDAS